MSSSADTTISSNKPEANAFWAIARLVVAAGVTAALLPLGLGYTLAFYVLAERVPPMTYTVFYPSVAAVLVLAWGVGSHRIIRPWTGWIFVGLVGVWFVSTYVVGEMNTASNADHLAIVAIYAASTLWMMWLAWIGFWPVSWIVRIAVLAVLGSALFGFHQFVAVSGLSGDAIVQVEWRKSLKSTDPNSLPEAESASAGSVEGSAFVETSRDYPQYLGPERVPALVHLELNPDWIDSPPEQIWRQPIGKGWGSFAIVGDRAFTQEQRGLTECVYCYDLLTGTPLWSHAEETIFESALGGDGPRATPTVHEGRVYAIGATGRLVCLDAVTGKLIWEQQTLANPSGNLMHGVCASPLIIGDLVYVCPVADEDDSLAAFDKRTGEEVFRAGGGRASYSSPQLVTIGGQPQILCFKSLALVAHDPTSGKVLWSFPWSNQSEVNASQPVIWADDAGDHVFVSTGYGTGAALLNVSCGPEGQWKVDKQWDTRSMKNKFATSVKFDDFVVGLDDGILAAIDLESGRKLWKGGRYKHGQVLRVGDVLLVVTEAGDLVLGKPTAEGWEELAVVQQAISGAKTWNHPAFAPPYLLLRNSEEAACYKLSLASDAGSETSEKPDSPESATPEPTPSDSPTASRESSPDTSGKEVTAPTSEIPAPPAAPTSDDVPKPAAAAPSLDLPDDPLPPLDLPK